MHKLFPRIRLGILGIEKLQPAFGFTGHRVAHNVVSLSHENKMISIYTFLEQRITNEHSGLSTTYFGDFWRTNHQPLWDYKKWKNCNSQRGTICLGWIKVAIIYSKLGFHITTLSTPKMWWWRWTLGTVHCSIPRNLPELPCRTMKPTPSMQLGRSVRLS